MSLLFKLIALSIRHIILWALHIHIIQSSVLVESSGSSLCVKATNGFLFQNTYLFLFLDFDLHVGVIEHM